MVSFRDRVANILAEQKPTILRFCNLEEQSTITNIFKSNENIVFDGGYPDSERKRVYFYTPQTDDIVCFKIIYPEKQLELTHQNILGTLLSLSITYDSIGDILPKQAVFFVVKELAEEIKRSFVAINNVPISLEEKDPSTVHSEQEFLEMEIISDSLRLDLIVSKLAKISRNEATERILKEWVKINQKMESKPTKQLQVGDVVSIRKSGRFIIDDTKKRTRKNKIVVKYRKFV